MESLLLFCPCGSSNSQRPLSLSLILIYTQTHPHHPHSVTPGPFPRRAWIRGGPYNVALGRVHPLTTHTPPTLPSPQGHPSSYTLRGGLLLACPEPYPPCPNLPHGEGGCSSQGQRALLEGHRREANAPPAASSPGRPSGSVQRVRQCVCVCVWVWGGPLRPCPPSAAKGRPWCHVAMPVLSQRCVSERELVRNEGPRLLSLPTSLSLSIPCRVRSMACSGSLGRGHARVTGGKPFRRYLGKHVAVNSKLALSQRRIWKCTHARTRARTHTQFCFKIEWGFFKRAIVFPG